MPMYLASRMEFGEVHFTLTIKRSLYEQRREMKRVYADIPKFKKIEAGLREVILKQRTICNAIEAVTATKKANQHEKQCLAAVRKDCEEAILAMKKAQHHLYDAFDDPKSDKKPVVTIKDSG